MGLLEIFWGARAPRPLYRAPRRTAGRFLARRQKQRAGAPALPNHSRVITSSERSPFGFQDRGATRPHRSSSLARDSTILKTLTLIYLWGCSHVRPAFPDPASPRSFMMCFTGICCVPEDNRQITTL